MKKGRLLLFCFGLIFAAASSYASLTPVQDIWGVQPGSSGEWNLYNSGVGSAQGPGIMEYIYGTGNFTRVNDASDIDWAGSPGGATFDAIYAGASQALYTAALAGTPISSEILGGSGYTGNAAPSRSPNTVSYIPESQPFLFLDQANGNMAYSDPGLSSGGVDRMVTFAVTGYLATPGDQSSWTAFSDGTTHYVVAFEDGTDFDYNDLVVEVSGVAPVPEATTFFAGVLLLLPLGASTMRILRRKRLA
jgi:hypothetical protein